MLRSVDGRSQKEVWAEFLSRFPKNCNTCRGRDKGRVEDTIILPDGMDVEVVLEKLGRLRGERYLLLINHLYFRGLYRKKTKKEMGNFLPVHRNTLVEIGGNRYSALLKYGMGEGHIIKSPKTYLVGERSNEYRLNSGLLNFKRQQAYTLTVKSAVRIWKTRPSKRRRSFVKNSAARAKIAKSVKGLTFDYSKAFDYVAKIKDRNQQSHRVAVLAQLISDGQTWSYDNQGRNYTVMVNIPSELRHYFTYQGESLGIIDINSSQPLLHSLLYEKNEPEKVAYLRVVKKGFWDFMNKAGDSKFDLSDPDQKAQLKDKIWPQVFYGRIEDSQKPKGIYARAFKKKFPVLWQAIGDAKKGNHRPLPRAMMFIEAEGVMAVVEKLEKKPYPLITIHDAIVTTYKDAIKVGHAIRDVFAELELKPSLKLIELKPR